MVVKTRSRAPADKQMVALRMNPKIFESSDGKGKAAAHQFSKLIPGRIYGHTVTFLTIASSVLLVYVYAMAETVRAKRLNGYKQLSHFVRSADSTPEFYAAVAAHCGPANGFENVPPTPGATAALNPALSTIAQMDFHYFDTRYHEKFFSTVETTIYLGGLVAASLLAGFVFFHWFLGHLKRLYHKDAWLKATHDGVHTASHLLLAINTFMLLFVMFVDQPAASFVGRCPTITDFLKPRTELTYHKDMDHAFRGGDREHDLRLMVLAAFVIHAVMHYHVTAMAKSVIGSAAMALLGLGSYVHFIPQKAATDLEQETTEMAEIRETNISSRMESKSASYLAV